MSERTVFYVWLDGCGFYTGEHGGKRATWTSSRIGAFAFATREVASAVRDHYPRGMVMCCFAPGAAPDEQDGYAPKTREYESEGEGR